MLNNPERVDWHNYFEKRKTAELSAPKLQVQVEQTPESCQLILTGKLTAETKTSLLDVVHDYPWSTPVIVNLAELQHLDVDGTVGLFALYKVLNRLGIQCLIVSNNEHDLRLFATTSLNELIQVLPDLGSAERVIRQTESSHE